LAENAESENVRLKANTDLVDRAGWTPVGQSEVKEVSKFNDMSTKEIQAELDALLAADVFV